MSNSAPPPQKTWRRGIDFVCLVCFLSYYWPPWNRGWKWHGWWESPRGCRTPPPQIHSKSQIKQFNLSFSIQFNAQKKRIPNSVTQYHHNNFSHKAIILLFFPNYIDESLVMAFMIISKYSPSPFIKLDKVHFSFEYVIYSTAYPIDECLLLIRTVLVQLQP